MRITTRTLGKVDIDDRQFITFPRGILGFETHKRFALLDAPQPPFYWLQSLSDAQTAFVLISPDVFRNDYALSLESNELEVLEVQELEDGNLTLKNGERAQLLVFAIVTVSTDVSNMTANLQGPVIINPYNHCGLQGIQTDSRWKTKHFVLEEMSARSAVLSGKGS